MASMLVSPNQTAFMIGRVISDNTLLVDEMLHEVYVWCGRTIRVMDFSQYFISLISNCIQSTCFSVLVEGTPTSPFKGQRGLR